MRTPALVSCSDCDTAAVKAAGQGFFFFFYIQGGWLDGMKEKSEGARAQPRGVFDYQASKRPTFTDSFPLWALSIPHS